MLSVMSEPTLRLFSERIVDGLYEVGVVVGWWSDVSSGKYIITAMVLFWR
jgi:hypothetical protein